jgi:hypothetical protein
MLLSKVRAACAAISELQLDYAKAGMKTAAFTTFPRPFGRHGLGCAAGSKPGCRRFPACTYAWPRPDGSAGSGRDPVAVFTGEAVHAYLGHLPDKEIEAMLNELTAKAVAELCGLYLTDARSRIKTSTFSIDRSRIESHVKPLIGRHAVAAHLRKSGPRRPAPCRHQAAPLSVA